MSDKVKGWSETLDDEPDETGVQADIARKILAMNPSLRDAGLDTTGMVKQSQQRRAPLLDTLAAAKKKLAEEEKLALERVTRWIAAHDPEMRSPETQQALAEHREWLERIGFKKR